LELLTTTAVPELSGTFMSHTFKKTKKLCAEQGEQANGREEATFVPLQAALESVLGAMRSTHTDAAN
jgi:hypothetical protein